VLAYFKSPSRRIHQAVGHCSRTHPLVQAEFKEVSETLYYEKSTAHLWITLILPLPNLKRFPIVIILNIAAQAAWQ